MPGTGEASVQEIAEVQASFGVGKDRLTGFGPHHHGAQAAKELHSWGPGHGGMLGRLAGARRGSGVEHRRERWA